jgi:hypothetical protein
MAGNIIYFSAIAIPAVGLILKECYNYLFAPRDIFNIIDDIILKTADNETIELLKQYSNNLKICMDVLNNFIGELKNIKDYIDKKEILNVIINTRIRELDEQSDKLLDCENKLLLKIITDTEMKYLCKSINDINKDLFYKMDTIITYAINPFDIIDILNKKIDEIINTRNNDINFVITTLVDNINILNLLFIYGDDEKNEYTKKWISKITEHKNILTSYIKK